MNPFEDIKVVGVTFCEGYPDNLLTIRDMKAEGRRVWVTLVRNADNPVDVNAIEVHVPALSELNKPTKVGHLSAILAKRLAPRMDWGESWVTEVSEVLVGNHVGIAISIQGVLA
jgi:hypothetical protein